jgi:hypothetical protein
MPSILISIGTVNFSVGTCALHSIRTLWLRGAEEKQRRQPRPDGDSRGAPSFTGRWVRHSNMFYSSLPFCVRRGCASIIFVHKFSIVSAVLLL